MRHLFHEANGSQSDAVLYLPHTLSHCCPSDLLSAALAKRGRNVRNVSKFEMRILPSKSQKEPMSLVVEDTMSAILHYRISETFEV
jgi:hypothetical protein